MVRFTDESNDSKSDESGKTEDSLVDNWKS